SAARFDPRKGKPVSWLIGIARSCVDDFLRGRSFATAEVEEIAGADELETDTLLRLSGGEHRPPPPPRDAFLRGRSFPPAEVEEIAGADELERDTLLRLSVGEAVAALDD